MTWSLVAVDTASGAAGIAVASCVPLETVLRVPGIAEGRGVLATQSFLLDGQREAGLALLAAGEAPEVILAAMLDPSFDPEPEKRQIAIVDASGRLAAVTGSEAQPWAGNLEVRTGSLVASVQGNLLTGPEVLDASASALVDDDACDLPERLLRGLEAGGRERRGDARCVPLGVAAQSATLRVGSLVLDAGVAEPGADPDPLVTLREQLDAWRVDHLCPEPSAEGGGGSVAASSGGAPAASDGAPDAGGCTVACAPPGWEGAVLALAGVFVLRRCLPRRVRPPRHPGTAIASASAE